MSLWHPCGTLVTCCTPTLGSLLQLNAHLDFRLEDAGALLDDEVDVAQGNVLRLRLRVQQGHQRRGQLAGEGPGGVRICHTIQVGQDHLFTVVL